MRPPVTEQALAKVNLTLHVTGQREDGYHLLDSLVVFAGVGDVLHAVPAGVASLTLEGPFGAEVPAGSDNFVLRAARAFGGDPVAFTLIKKLPPASGIGGGSADAAAALRAMLRLRLGERAEADINLAAMAKDRAALSALGADVPVCLLSHPARMRGTGEVLDPLCVPDCWMVLVNPRVEVPTPTVFKGLKRKKNAAMPDRLPVWPDCAALARWVGAQRNDLQEPAIGIAPVISKVIAALDQTTGALVTRMSGSGATCFALFATKAEANAAATEIGAKHPDWWVAAAFVYPGRAEMAQLMRDTT